MPDHDDAPVTISPFEQARAAAEAIARVYSPTPRIGIVLGSGLGGLADALDSATVLPFAEIPYLLPPSVTGHAGQLVLGTIAGVPVAVLRGRVHLYEGYTPQQITFPIRVLGQLGVEACILTNAAGGLEPTLRAGSLMLVRDHIGLPSLAGINPLFGPNDERMGPRFVAMTDAYDPALRELAKRCAIARGLSLAEGVYAMVGGPNFETPAELRMLRLLGADAVGMSTVPEAIVARHMGMRVMAVSCITNQALSDSDGSGELDVPDHAQVLRTAAKATEQLIALLGDVIAQYA